MIYDVIYTLFVLIEKLAFSNKQLQCFIMSLNERKLFSVKRNIFIQWNINESKKRNEIL